MHGVTFTRFCIAFEEPSEVWIEDETAPVCDDFELSRDDSPPSDVIITEDEQRSKRLNAWLVMFIVHLQTVFHLTDMATDCILKFLSAFLTVLGRFAPICSSIVEYFPHNLYKLRKYNGSKLPCRKYVTCRKCHRIYRFTECVQGHGLCTFQEFPKHRQQRMREPCGTALLKSVELIGGRKILYPFMTYCYLGLQTSLIPLLQRADFHELTEHWKHRSNMNGSGILEDIYDGRVWSEFQHYDNEPFLSTPLSLGLMINIDWFQPYKHVTYSVGAIYLVILNLPRHIRYKRENVLLIGILPGPHEPSRDMNSYLDPLVDEFLLLWKGVSLDVGGFSYKKLVKCALLCASCDIPAGKKACGFIGHAGHKGCSRCLKSFTGGIGTMNYGGFDRENWPLRTVQAHREVAKKLSKCTTKAARQKLESGSGFRYTAFLNLPYFNPSRMLIVDPMHNLFLGTAKRVLRDIWIENDIITASDFQLIQERVDKCLVPSDIGRIPYKINSSFSAFTADQYKNWVVYFSLLTLQRILTGNELECWRHFVLACRILLKYSLTLEQVTLADLLLLNFCRRSERMHGSSVVTPNMHLHCHLKECILDYGPLHGFWCFPFERFNGLLGSQPNNNRSIEVQLMNRFLTDSTLMNLPLPDSFTDEFASLIPHSKRVVGALLDHVVDNTSVVQSNKVLQTFNKCGLNRDFHVTLPKFFAKCIFTSGELCQLQAFYCKLFSLSQDSQLELCSMFRKYRSLQINHKQIGCYNSRSSNSSTVLAVWNHDLFGTPHPDHQPFEHRPVRIHHFAQHFFHVNGQSQSQIFVSVSWYKMHQGNESAGKPITVWECDIFESSNHNLIPVEFIICRTVSLVDKFGVTGAHALLVCPCTNF